MRVDFYQLSRDPVERVVAMLARKVLQAGSRLLVVSADAEQRQRFSRELWRAAPEEFLAHGETGRGHEDRQPILLSDRAEPMNGADMVLLADGIWREEALQFDRALLVFGERETDAARSLWRALDGKEEVEREIHKQDESGKWRAGG